MTINKKLAFVQSELKVHKSQYNSFGKYNYRNCEDILEAVKPLLKEQGLTLLISDEIINLGDRFYVRATARISDGNENLDVSALARESMVKKGMDEAQITGAASSYARKYALNGLFLIDDTRDPDTKDNTEKKEIKAKYKQTGTQKAKLMQLMTRKGLTIDQKKATEEYITSDALFESTIEKLKLKEDISRKPESQSF